MRAELQALAALVAEYDTTRVKAGFTSAIAAALAEDARGAEWAVGQVLLMIESQV